MMNGNTSGRAASITYFEDEERNCLSPMPIGIRTKREFTFARLAAIHCSARMQNTIRELDGRVFGNRLEETRSVRQAIQVSAAATRSRAPGAVRILGTCSLMALSRPVCVTA